MAGERHRYTVRDKDNNKYDMFAGLNEATSLDAHRRDQTISCGWQQSQVLLQMIRKQIRVFEMPLSVISQNLTKLGLVFVAIALFITPVHAEMKFYQIARLLNFKTGCKMRDFEDRSPKAGPGRFFVTCDNVTSYPDGLTLECSDRTNEWTCRILTEARTFKSLDMLRPR